MKTNISDPNVARDIQNTKEHKTSVEMSMYVWNMATRAPRIEPMSDIHHSTIKRRH